MNKNWLLKRDFGRKETGHYLEFATCDERICIHYYERFDKRINVFARVYLNKSFECLTDGEYHDYGFDCEDLVRERFSIKDGYILINMEFYSANDTVPSRLVDCCNGVIAGN